MGGLGLNLKLVFHLRIFIFKVESISKFRRGLEGGEGTDYC